MAFTVAFEKTLANTSTEWANFTLVQSIPAVGEATAIRLTLKGSTLSATKIQSMYIGKRGADAFDFAATPVQVFVGGQGTFEIPQNGQLVTDSIPLVFDGATDLIIAISFSSDTTKDDIRTLFGGGSGCSYYFKSSFNDAATVNKTGYGAAGNNPNALALISKVEVERPAPLPEPVGWKIDHFAVVRPAWLASTMPIVDYVFPANPYIWVRIGHLPISVLPGDILDISSCFETTNPLNYWVELTSCLLLGNSSTGTEDLVNIPSFYSEETSTGAKLLTPVIGENVGPHAMEHHHIARIDKKYKVPAGCSGNKYIILLAYAGGSSLTTPNNSLVVEASSVDISCIRFRPIYGA
ncbi:MAG: hypothetical protein ACK5X3_24290 [Pseudomonadota bacterium]|jgi:hypothetical protein